MKHKQITSLKDYHPTLQNVLHINTQSLIRGLDDWQLENDQLRENNNNPAFRRWALIEGFKEQGFRVLNEVTEREQTRINLGRQVVMSKQRWDALQA